MVDYADMMYAYDCISMCAFVAYSYSGAIDFNC
jgi:hypothetical protein